MTNQKLVRLVYPKAFCTSVIDGQILNFAVYSNHQNHQKQKYRLFRTDCIAKSLTMKGAWERAAINVNREMIGKLES